MKNINLIFKIFLEYQSKVNQVLSDFKLETVLDFFPVSSFINGFAFFDFQVSNKYDSKNEKKYINCQTFINNKL